MTTLQDVAPMPRGSVLTEFYGHYIGLCMIMLRQTLIVEKISKNNPLTCICFPSTLCFSKSIIEYNNNIAFAKLKENKEFSSVFVSR